MDVFKFVVSSLFGVGCVLVAGVVFKESVILNPLGISNPLGFLIGLLLLAQAAINFSNLKD